MHTYLEKQFSSGFFSALDLSFARFIGEMEEEDYASQMMFLAALVSRELNQGHVCVDLNAIGHLILPEIPGETIPSDVADFFQDPKRFVYELSAAKTLSIIDTENSQQPTPLVCDLERLYLYRYWNDETILAHNIMQMATKSLPVAQQAKDVLHRLFPSEGYDISWQMTAAAVALSRQFSVISGGPGTGKTTTVAKLLATLLSQDNQLNIRLAAPTGKAAARLSESIGQAVSFLDIDTDIKSLIPHQAQTLHRLLGARANSKMFTFNADNLLHLDVLILDEASMVDLPLMTRLIEALPKDARLILLGDRDQLASVEAGAVLGDICKHIDDGYTEHQAQILQHLTGFNFSNYASAQSTVNDSLCLLHHSYRFDADSGIGQLAKAINIGSTSAVTHVLQQGFTDIAYNELVEGAYRSLIKLGVEVYTPYLEAIYNQASAEQVLDLFSQAQILCAVRVGELGVEGINQAIKKALIKEKLLPQGEQKWYVGRPIMIMHNDAHLGLFNGDIGICLRAEKTQQLKVYFVMPDGEVKAFLPSRLPEHQDVYAMTVHKSQGSEFAHTIMVLPSYFSPVITRELIYTGVTRAKSRLTLYTKRDVFNRGIKKRTHRASGLGARLS